MNGTKDSPSGYVSALYISKEKGHPREEIREGYFKENFGLEGDSWSGAGDRQVVILSRKRRLDVEDDIRNGLCFPRFKETLQVDGIPLEEYAPGTQFQAGEALLEIAGVGKRCFGECEVIQSGGEVCSLKKGAVFARVLKSGMIRKNDGVKILE